MRSQEDGQQPLQRKERVLNKTTGPLCGDLLGRERVSGAKKLRSGCDYGTERFDNIIENVAQWHTKQSFLGVYINVYICIYIIYTTLEQSTTTVSPCQPLHQGKEKLQKC